jgi:uncharacterized protein GlcG (DUF336 family)
MDHHSLRQCKFILHICKLTKFQTRSKFAFWYRKGIQMTVLKSMTAYTLLCLTGTSCAMAQDLPSQKLLSLALANEVAMKAVEKCKADGYRVSVVVTDRNGTAIVVLRGDGTGPHTVDSAMRKAYTAASMRTTTMELGERLTKNPGSAGLASLPNVITLAGGIPIKLGDDVIGAAGAGGAPGGDKDAACVQAGIDAVAAKLK